MHEFALAEEVIELAGRELKKHKASVCSAIKIEVGSLSGVDPAAFETALRLLAEVSVLKDANIEMTHLPGKGICSECGTEFEMSHRMETCPECSGFPSVISGGTEFRVVSLDIE